MIKLQRCGLIQYGYTLSVDLSDGRTISVPTAWCPRLSHAEPKERENRKLIGGGHGIHWEDIDEDISVEDLLAGKSSGESQQSFKKGLKQENHAGALPDRFFGANTAHIVRQSRIAQC